MLADIEATLTDGGSVDREQAAWLWTHASDDELKRLAGLVRARWHAPDEATWLVMAIVNYTNVCVAKCDYCAFYRLPKDPEGYLLSWEQVAERLDRLLVHGGRLVGFNGGFHPGLRLSDYAEFFGKIRERYGEQLDFYEFTVAEFMYYCKVSKVSYDEGARLLASTGTRWVTGGGSEVLDDDFRRRHSPLKYKVDDFYQAQQAILDAGMGSTATMVIGFDETLDERLNHLERLRAFQDSVDGALPSFLCWTYKPYSTDLGGGEVTLQEYLRWLAICRIYLHNFQHIRTSVLTRNADALLGLDYGANDFDLPTEDEVTESAGATISTDFERILQTGRERGYRLLRREPFSLRGEVTYTE